MAAADDRIGMMLRGAAVACISAVALSAYAAEPMRAQLEGDFHEAVHEEVGVSGSVVAGVATADAFSGNAALAGLMIRTHSPHVCLEVLSRDGVYSSRNSYVVPNTGDGAVDALVVLPFEGTRQRNLIRRYGDGELAVRATPGACDEAGNTYLVASQAAGFDRVDVLVNSMGANEVYYRAADGTEGDCIEFTKGRRTSYDFRCSVPLIGDGPQKIRIERERYGRSLGTAILELQPGSHR